MPAHSYRLWGTLEYPDVTYGSPQAHKAQAGIKHMCVHPSIHPSICFLKTLVLFRVTGGPGSQLGTTQDGA